MLGHSHTPAEGFRSRRAGPAPAPAPARCACAGARPVRSNSKIQKSVSSTCTATLKTGIGPMKPSNVPAMAVAVQDDRRLPLGDRLGEAVAAEEAPDRLPLALERRRRRRVVQQRDPDRAAGDLLQRHVQRAHLRPGLRVDRPQQRLAEVRAAPSRGSRRRSPSRPRARSRPRRPSQVALRRSITRTPPRLEHAHDLVHPVRVPVVVPEHGEDRHARPRQASASTAACSGSPWVVRSPASRIEVGPLADPRERLRDLGPVALVAVDVACGGDPDGLIRHPGWVA